MSDVYLVSDTRERSVHGFIESLFGPANATHVVAQINTGDYLVCRRLAGAAPEILACVERKTLKDFASSFADGRYLNRHKMMDLRDKTGCQLYFFVEGPAFPQATWKIPQSRTTYGAILSAMTHMMLRDGIFVVQTKDESGTAQRLLDFVKGFGVTDIPYLFPIKEGGASDNCTPAGVPEIVMGVVEKSDDLLATEMWGKLTGISIPTAQIIANSFTAADLVAGRADDRLEALRTATGRQLTKKGKSSLLALKNGNAKVAVKLLAGVPGISPATAARILEGRSIDTLLQLGRAEIANCQIHQKGRVVRLGDARAERIWRLMNYEPRDGDANDGDANDEGTPVAVAVAAANQIDDDDFDALFE